MRLNFPKNLSLIASTSALTLMVYLGAGAFATSPSHKIFSISSAWAAQEKQEKSAKTSESFQKLQEEILEPDSSEADKKTNEQNSEKDSEKNGQSGDLPLSEPADPSKDLQNQTDNSEKPNITESSAPAFQPTTILPSKIKPVHDSGGEDSLSRAAAPIKSATQTNDSGSVDSTQSLGLLTLPSAEDAHFGDAWDKLKSKETIKKFSQIDANKSSPEEAQNTIAVLSRFVPSDIKEEKTPSKNSTELYNVRLKKLLEFGEFEKITQLYKMNNSAPPSSDALYAGVVSMLATGDQALACLEYKAGNPEFKQSPALFWGHMGVFCNILVSPAANAPNTDPNTKSDNTKGQKHKNTSKSNPHTTAPPTQNPDGLMDSVKLAQLEARKKWLNAARLYLTATNQNTPNSLPTTLTKLNDTDPLTLLAWGGTGMLTPLLKPPGGTSSPVSQTLPLSDLTRLSALLLLHSGIEDPVILQALRDMQTKEKPEEETNFEQKSGL